MGSDRLMRDLPSSDVQTDRDRVQEMLAVVLDDLIVREATVEHPVAEALLRSFALELVGLRRAVREGATVEEFARDRKPKDGRCDAADLGASRDERG